MLREMKQLEHIITSLETDQFYAVRVVNAATGSIIGANLTGALMAERFGSIEGFFNKLFTDGLQAIIIQPRRKNGSSYKDFGTAETIRMIPADQPQQQATPAYQPTLNQPVHIPEVMPGLMGMGLNTPQAIYHTMDYGRLQRENDKLTVENEAHKKEIEKLKYEALESRFSDSKATGNKEMLNGLMEVAVQMAPMFLAGRGGGAIPTPGLGQPAAEVSQSKARIIQAITAQDDHVVDYLMLILNGFSNEAFAAELITLLQKHKLIPEQNG